MDGQIKITESEISIVLINDCSKQPFPDIRLENINTYLIENKWSRGHQESIVEGLRYCAEYMPTNHIVVMDGDGEDLVEDITKLLLELAENPMTQVICARRGKRDVSTKFTLGYFAFRMLFRFLTGKNIQTGNFMVIRNNSIETIMMFPNLSTNLAASVMRYSQATLLVRLDRGSRFFGQSKMKTTRLILHGYSAIAVFADIALSRMILLSTLSLIGSIFILLFVLILKVLGLLQAIPGWTSIILLQVVTLFLVPFYLVVFITIVFLNLKWKDSMSKEEKRERKEKNEG